jgi:hypothetical protein
MRARYIGRDATFSCQLLGHDALKPKEPSERLTNTPFAVLADLILRCWKASTAGGCLPYAMVAIEYAMRHGEMVLHKVCYVERNSEAYTSATVSQAAKSHDCSMLPDSCVNDLTAVHGGLGLVSVFL